MKQIHPLFFLFLILFSGLICAQSAKDTLRGVTVSTSAAEIIRYDIKKGLLDGLDIIKVPTHFTTGDWITAGAVVGATSLSMLLDNDIRNVVRRNHTNSLSDITKIGQYYGEVIPAVSLSAGAYAVGLIARDRSVSLTGRLMGESLLYAGTINLILKVLFSRSRPYNNKGNMDFWNYNFDNAYYSLPSGHTTVAFTLSTVLAERINNIYATIGLYTLAVLTAYQRIYSDNHWFSDTVLGAVIGIVISHGVVQMNENDPLENEDSQISGINLMLDQGYGFGFRIAF